MVLASIAQEGQGSGLGAASVVRMHGISTENIKKIVLIRL
jgi:hypothetical protein